MLETLPRVSVTQDVHRLANLDHVRSFAAKKGLTIDQVADVIAFHRDDVTKELLEGPFERKLALQNKYGKVSRFSNGEWPVFYGAVGQKTAEEESKHHYARQAAGDAEAKRSVHYSIVRYKFSGEIVDLRPKLSEWRDLISDCYTFCNGLGKEAHHDGGIGAFLSPSARHTGGTTVPAFIQGTVSDPVIEAAAKLTFDAGNVAIEAKEL
jgi:hypothetical protein